MPYVFLIMLTKEEEKNKMLRQRNFRHSIRAPRAWKWLWRFI